MPLRRLANIGGKRITVTNSKRLRSSKFPSAQTKGCPTPGGTTPGASVAPPEGTTPGNAAESEAVKWMRRKERGLAKQGFKYVVGTDEAGRGPLAGPVVAGACWVPDDVVIEGIGDSKALKEEQREELYEKLTAHPKVKWAVSIQGPEVIDKINILAASMKAMVESVKKLDIDVDYVLVDGNRRPPFEEDLNAEPVVKGDKKCYCIAAASILAKVTRDRIMLDLDKKYPLYGLAGHKGYPTKEHKRLVMEHGPSEIHRKTFAPIKTMGDPAVWLKGTYLDPALQPIKGAKKAKSNVKEDKSQKKLDFFMVKQSKSTVKTRSKTKKEKATPAGEPDPPKKKKSPAAKQPKKKATKKKAGEPKKGPKSRKRARAKKSPPKKAKKARAKK